MIISLAPVSRTALAVFLLGGLALGQVTYKGRDFNITFPAGWTVQDSATGNLVKGSILGGSCTVHDTAVATAHYNPDSLAAVFTAAHSAAKKTNEGDVTLGSYAVHWLEFQVDTAFGTGAPGVPTSFTFNFRVYALQSQGRVFSAVAMPPFLGGSSAGFYPDVENAIKTLTFHGAGIRGGFAAAAGRAWGLDGAGLLWRGAGPAPEVDAFDGRGARLGALAPEREGASFRYRWIGAAPAFVRLGAGGPALRLARP